MKGSAVFDLLANIPFELFFTLGKEKPKATDLQAGRMYKMFKLLRIPRLFELLNVDRIKQYITAYYTKRLEMAVKHNLEGE